MKTTYAYHKPSDASLELITKIREAFSELHFFIEDNVKPSRERSIAITELETSAMWAIKSVVFNDPESEAIF